MRRTLLIVLLGAGTVLGFASGFAHVFGHRRYGYGHGWCGNDRSHHGWQQPSTPPPTPAP